MKAPYRPYLSSRSRREDTSAPALRRARAQPPKREDHERPLPERLTGIDTVVIPRDLRVRGGHPVPGARRHWWARAPGGATMRPCRPSTSRTPNSRPPLGRAVRWRTKKNRPLRAGEEASTRVNSSRQHHGYTPHARYISRRFRGHRGDVFRATDGALC
jgi:hypothetical protein